MTYKKREQMTREDRDWNAKHDPKVHRHWVDVITERSPDEFSDEEQSFLENCDRRLKDGRPLTEPMIRWLEDIYVRSDD